jgi:hypothetical protein
MSSNTPSGQPEYLGTGEPDGSPARSGRRWPVLGAAAVGVVAVVGLGGWGAFALLSGGGAQPAEAVPGRAVGYLSLDLDPAAAQKIEAIKILRKFPGIAEELDVSGTDDLRRVIFEQMQQEDTCTDLDYDDDIEPWIGERVALAAVPDKDPGVDAPVLVLQVNDQDAAEDGIQALARCSDAGDYGYAFLDGYALITDTDKRAEALAAEAEESSLADDATFQEWTGRVGDPGIVTVYGAPGAPELLLDMQHDMGEGWFSYAAGSQPERPELYDEMEPMYRDFEGMAAVVRFDDGAVEAEVATRGMPTAATPVTAATGPNITELPASTGAAFSVALADGWLADYLESMAGMFGTDQSVEELLVEAERQTGLELPEDIETLLGDGVSLSVDADVDIDAIFEEGDPSRLPVGLRVSGDPDEIMPVVDKVRAAIGHDAHMLLAEPGDGVVAFGLNAGYVDTLLADGSLGEEATFRRAVPQAENASGVLYVNFDAGNGWAEELADSIADLESQFTGEPSSSSPRENVAPLDALGISSWLDGDVQRGLFRLTTD